MRATRRSTALCCLMAAAVTLGPLLVVPPPAQAAGETVVGELVQAWPEHVGAHAADAAPEEPLTWVDPVRGDSVRVPTEDLPDIDGLVPGATVEVVLGAEVADEPADEGLEPARDLVDVEVLEAAPASPSTASTGVNRVTVVLVSPGGVPADATTTADVVAKVEEAATFWSGQSGGRIQLQVEATHGWVSTTSTCAKPELLFPEVDRAVGWPGVPGDRRHLLLYVPPGTPGCYAGLATVGSGIPDGGYLYTSALMTSVVAHEFGHNFSLGHASALQCDGRVDSGRCGLTPYADWYDVMGTSWAHIGTLGGPHAAQLGLLPADAVRTLRTAGSGETVTLQPVSAATGLRRLRIDGADGSVYWLEYRTSSGQDGWLAGNAAGLEEGVVLRLAGDGDDTSLLLDASPSAEAGWGADSALALTAVGQRADLADGDLAVRVTAMSPSGVTLQVRTPLEVRAEGLSWLGAPTGAQVCGLRGGGCRRSHANGSLYWSPAIGARFVGSELRGRYDSTGPNGPLGYPVHDTDCSTGSQQCVQRFEGGWIAATPGSGVFAVQGQIRWAWEALGGPAGAAGRPVSEEWCGLIRGGCYQRFTGGWVYWSPGTGAHLVDAGFLPLFERRGYEHGALGYPLSSTSCGLHLNGCVQRFEGGLMYRSNYTGPVVVWNGPIRKRYLAGGREAGPLGLPMGAERCNRPRSACTQDFEGGTVRFNARYGTFVVPRTMTVAAYGLGWPLAERRCGLVRGGCFQRFEGGSVYWSPATGAHGVGQMSKAIAKAYAAQGYERGRLGYPIGRERSGGPGYVQRFQGGTLVEDIAAGVVRRR